MVKRANQGSTIVLRVIFVIWGWALLMLALGLALQARLAVWLWPWPDNDLTYLFLGSILAAIALPTIWIGLTGEFAAASAGALALILSYTGIAGSLLWVLQSTGDLQLVPYLVVAVLSALFNVLIFFLSHGMPLYRQYPVPTFVQGVFFIFAVLLIVAGSALVVRIPYILPWSLQADSSLLLSWIFYGAAVYFLYCLLAPQWGHVCGQLLGLLAHATVMIGPLIAHFWQVEPEHLPGLIAYLSILVLGWLFAGYFLFLHRMTRFWGRQTAD